MSEEKKEKKYSYSQVNEMMLCPAKYDFKYRKNIRMSKTTADMLLGSAAAKCIQQFHENNSFSEELFSQELKSLIKEYETVDWKDYCQEDIEMLGGVLLKSYWEKEKNTKVIGCEVPFEVRIDKKGEGDYLFGGFIDQLIEREENGKKLLVVREFKAGKTVPTPEALSRNFQLGIYVLPFVKDSAKIWDRYGREVSIKVMPVMEYVNLRKYINNECRIIGCEKTTTLPTRVASEKMYGTILCADHAGKVKKGKLVLSPEIIKGEELVKAINPIQRVYPTKEGVQILEESVADAMYAIRMGVKYKRCTWDNACGWCDYSNICKPFLTVSQEVV